MARYPWIYDRNLTKGFGEVLGYVNEVTQSAVSNMVLLGIFLIIAFTTFQTKKEIYASSAIAGFATFIIAVLFWLAGFIAGVTVLYPLVVALFGFIGSLWNRSE